MCDQKVVLVLGNPPGFRHCDRFMCTSFFTSLGPKKLQCQPNGNRLVKRGKVTQMLQKTQMCFLIHYVLLFLSA